MPELQRTPKEPSADARTTARCRGQELPGALSQARLPNEALKAPHEPWHYKALEGYPRLEDLGHDQAPFSTAWTSPPRALSPA